MFKILFITVKSLFHLFRFISMISLFIAFFMMIVWMSAISNHFLGSIEDFFNNIVNITRLIYNGKIVIFNTTLDLTYPFTSLVCIVLSYMSFLAGKLLSLTEKLIFEIEQRVKLRKEIILNKELENSYKKNTLSQNTFIAEIILKESETCKEISPDDSHLYINRLLNLINQQNIKFNYEENIKRVRMSFDKFEDIDKVVKCINYWTKNLIKPDYTAVILLDNNDAQTYFNKIFRLISSGKIITNTPLKAKYNFLPEQSFTITSEGTFIINNSEIELFSFN